MGYSNNNFQPRPSFAQPTQPSPHSILSLESFLDTSLPPPSEHRSTPSIAPHPAHHSQPMLFAPTPPPPAQPPPGPTSRWGPVLPQQPPQAQSQAPPQRPDSAPRSQSRARPKRKDKDKDRDSDSEDEDVPLGPWDNMYYLAEAARLKADPGHPTHGAALSPTSSPVVLRGTDFGDTQPVPDAAGKKRKRHGSGKGKVRWEQKELEDLKRKLPVVRGREGEEGGDQEVFDPIVLGFCSEEEGRRLYNV